MAKKNSRNNSSRNGEAAINRLIKKMDKFMDESRKDRRQDEIHRRRMEHKLDQYAKEAAEDCKEAARDRMDAAKDRREAAEDRKILIRTNVTMNASLQILAENSAKTNLLLGEVIEKLDHMDKKLDKIDRNTSGWGPNGRRNSKKRKRK